MVYSLPCSLSSTVSRSLLKFMSIESVMLSNYLILYCPPSSFAFSLSQHQGLFQWISSSHQVAKILELQHQSFLNEYSGLISFRIDCLVSLQSKGFSRVFSSTTVWKHQFFGAQSYFLVQLSHPFVTAGKTIGLTIWIFTGKMMSLAF